MEKRGELTSSQIVGIVILIIGFVIVLIFMLLYLDLENYSEDEICRLSVITRATAPEAVQRFAPLKCTTEKICLSQNKKDCANEFKGEKNVADSVQLSSDAQKAADKIEETIANKMYDCWKMMGEGKLDILGGSALDIFGVVGWDKLGGKDSSCIICSRVSLKNVPPEVKSKIDLNDYLEKTSVPDGSGDTYLEKFTDHRIKSYPKEFEADFTKESQQPDEIDILFMQILTPETPGEVFAETGVKSAAFVFGAGTAVFPFKIALLGKITALSVLAGATTGGVAALQTWRNRNIAAGYCGEFTSVEKGRAGCSIVTGFDHSQSESINEFCAVLEGNP